MKNDKKVKKIAFINIKGGCGKSTSIFNIAGILSEYKEKVLVIDLDWQGNVSSFLLTDSQYPEKTVYDVMQGVAEPGEAVARARFKRRSNAAPNYFGVDCMVSDFRLGDVGDIDKEYFQEKLLSFIEDMGYEWVLIDMPPSNMVLNEICLHYIANNVITPFSSDMTSVTGYDLLSEIINEAKAENEELNNLGIFLSRYAKTCSIDKQIKELLEEHNEYLNVEIPYTTDIRETTIVGRPINYYKRFSESKKAYESLVKKIRKLAK